MVVIFGDSVVFSGTSGNVEEGFRRQCKRVSLRPFVFNFSKLLVCDDECGNVVKDKRLRKPATAR